MKWVFPDLKRNSEESVLDYLLRARGVSDIESFVHPSKEHIHGWQNLYDAAKASRVILDHIENGRKIYIHGDYDVDGVSATSILWDFLHRELGADVVPYIPSRFDQGYGLTSSSVEAMVAGGAELIVTVDCGIKDIEIVKQYTQKGISFVITDHHTLLRNDDGDPIVSEDALAVVHPLHPQGSYEFPEICGTAVAWKLIWALNDISRQNKDIFKYIDLVALATVCDVMPLVDENRAIVKLGIQRMNESPSLGIRQLSTSLRNDKVETYHLGYVLGPRINAAGRMSDAMLAVRLLTTSSEVHAKRYLQQLESLNTERQNLTKTLMDEAIGQVEQQIQNNLLFAYGEEWSEGIVGLVAGKLADKYSRPVIVGALSEQKMVASARSVSGFHIANELSALSELLERHGGHELAAGFTVAQGNIDELQARLTARANDTIRTDAVQKMISIDVVVEDSDLSISLIESLERMEPFGMSNEQPVFAIQKLNISKVQRFGNEMQHLKITISNRPDLEFVLFGRADEYADILKSKELSAAFTLGINEWNGRKKIQGILRDIKDPNKP